MVVRCSVVRVVHERGASLVPKLMLACLALSDLGPRLLCQHDLFHLLNGHCTLDVDPLA